MAWPKSLYGRPRWKVDRCIERRLRDDDFELVWLDRNRDRGFAKYGRGKDEECHRLKCSRRISHDPLSIRVRRSIPASQRSAAGPKIMGGSRRRSKRSRLRSET